MRCDSASVGEGKGREAGKVSGGEVRTHQQKQRRSSRLKHRSVSTTERFQLALSAACARAEGSDEI